MDENWYITDNVVLLGYIVRVLLAVQERVLEKWNAGAWTCLLYVEHMHRGLFCLQSKSIALNNVTSVFTFLQ